MSHVPISKKALQDENEALHHRLATLENELMKHRLDLSRLKHNESKNKQLIASRTKLFSIIAHELRNPFTALLGISDLLSENFRSYAPEKSEAMLSHLNSAAKSAYSLLENLLLWVRTQNGMMKFRPRNIDLDLLIRETADSILPLVLLKKITVQKLPHEPICAYTDENMFRIILQNLLTNAVKFSHPGGSVEIDVCKRDDETIVTINDHGIGMTEGMRKSLFQLNPCISRPGTAREKGSGLGLVLCRELIEKHGGRIWVRSKPNQGASFSFSLPERPFSARTTAEQSHRFEAILPRVP